MNAFCLYGRANPGQEVVQAYVADMLWGVGYSRVWEELDNLPSGAALSLIVVSDFKVPSLPEDFFILHDGARVVLIETTIFRPSCRLTKEQESGLQVFGLPLDRTRFMNVVRPASAAVT